MVTVETLPPAPTSDPPPQAADAAIEHRRHWRPVAGAVLLAMVAQVLLAVAIARGGDPVVGAMAAIGLAVCGLTLVGAATLRSMRRRAQGR